ncbi:MAG: DUF4419 domain-containing protein [Bacteroidaceae bacterium]|nr:DUF4419 domain-containing protein [Bacteroidaceae bacterium]
MKRILLPIILCCFVVCQLPAQTKDCKILNKSEGAITFEVDEGLEVIQEEYPRRHYPPTVTIRGMLQAMQISESDFNVVAHGIPDSIQYMGEDAFYQTLVRAYAYHRPLVLSPDMIWLLISQSFGEFVYKNAEELRSQIVSHEGQKEIKIYSKHDLLSDKDVDWDDIFNQFEQQLAANTKGDIAKTITADFTTTGRTERIASQITLMNALKQYFKYVVAYMICGIPSITLQGTVADWEKVLKKTQTLEKYGMGWWTTQLEPILEEFVKAAAGHPNSKFWKDIVMQDRPDRLRGGGCSTEQPTNIDGWFLKLFPDVEKKTVPLTVPHNKTMKSEQVRVPFKYVIENRIGEVLKTYDMEMIAGFVGVEEDSQTYALTPKIGWVVRRGNEEEDAIARIIGMTNESHYILPAEEVMPILQKIKHAKYLQLSFEGKVELPDWMDDMQIDHFTIYNDISTKEEEALKKRFPQLEVKRGKHYRLYITKFIK